MLSFADKWGNLLLGILVLFGLYLASLYNYLLFHSLAEVFSIIVAWGMFMFAWNSHRYMENNYLLFIGIAYLFIAAIDMAHTLAYKGMNIFEGYGPNLPTKLWIAARSMESISLVIAMVYLKRKLHPARLFFIYFAVTALIFWSIFQPGIFPDCFVEGTGLTLFKKVSEYIISFIILMAIGLLVKNRRAFEPDVFRLLLASMLLTIGAELSFTFYVSVYGVSNLVGHLFKIISFYLIYRAIIVSGLTRPIDLLFRNLKLNEASLRKEKEKLETALEEIKTLKGILPMCSHCKKIRDDQGNWEHLEEYIEDHSKAEISHSICPECAEKHYPGMGLYEKT